MYTILVGETITIPARDITDDMLRMKVDQARAHNHPESIDKSLRPGGKAKILSAFQRLPSRAWDDVVKVDFDDNEVRVTGVSRGIVNVDVIDALSAPGGVTGIAGGYEVLVQDEYDRQIMEQVAEMSEEQPEQNSISASARASSENSAGASRRQQTR